MMEYGATIKEAHVKHLRDLIPQLQCNEKTVVCIVDNGFRGAGKRQFLAALDHYQAGRPRSFQEPSCHCCGKINADIKDEGKNLMKCGGCKNEISAAWFCDKVRMAVYCCPTLHIVDKLIVLPGMSESPVEAPQAHLRYPWWERNGHLQVVRQDHQWHHRLRGLQRVRLLHDDGTGCLSMPCWDGGWTYLLSSHPRSACDVAR